MNRKIYTQLLIKVTPDNEISGYETKENCHAGEGILHRAFSIFIFNDNKELLLQKRSNLKSLWPLFWSNSACSHPHKGESYDEASKRRLKEELGIDTHLQYLYKFQYQAKFNELGSENELCAVYIGKENGAIKVDPQEIVQWKYISIEQLNESIKNSSGDYTPWFRMEWERICSSYMNEILKL